MTTYPTISNNERLTWHKARRCYRKCYKGRVYYLRGDGSHLPTQENFRAALAEWAVKKRTLDNQQQEADIARKMAKTVELLDEYTTELRNGTNKELRVLGLPPLIAPRVCTIPLGEAAKLYLDDHRSRAVRGEVSVGRYEHVTGYVTAFLDFVGEKTDSNAVTETTLQEFRNAITARINNGKKGRISDYTARYTLQATANFVDWLWVSKFLLDRPRNIEVFQKVKVAKRPVRFFTVDQVKALWSSCENGWQKLFLALALNTGMNQADMAALTAANLEAPFLVMKRRKTGVLACWKLWPVTWTLIESCKKSDPKKPTRPLFLSRRGRPLVERGFRKDGRTFKNDAVRQVFHRVLARAKIQGSFVMLRKTVATLLKSRGYGDVVQFFLAHSNDALFLSNGVVTKEMGNGSVADTFYVGEEAKVQALKNHPRLLEALALLEREFGLAEGE